MGLSGFGFAVDKGRELRKKIGTRRVVRFWRCIFLLSLGGDGVDTTGLVECPSKHGGPVEVISCLVSREFDATDVR